MIAQWFLAQINFEEIASLQKTTLLPKTGMLYIFQYFTKPVNEYGCEYLFQPLKDSYKIIYYNGELSNLHKSTFPKTLFNKFHFKDYKMILSYKYQVTSSTETIKYELANLTKADDSTLNEFNNYTQENIYTSNSILGTPSPVQYGVDVDWALSHLGYTFDKMTPDTYKKVYEDKKTRVSFVNLFSFEFGTFFSNIGDSKCFIGITKEDLQNRNFNKVILIHQGT